MLFISYKLVIYFTNEPQTHLNRTTKQNKIRGGERQEGGEEKKKKRKKKKWIKRKGKDMTTLIYSGAESLSQTELRVCVESGTYRRLQNGHDQTVMEWQGEIGRWKEGEPGASDSRKKIQRAEVTKVSGLYIG